MQQIEQAQINSSAAHPHRASVCTWTQTEPVQNPPPLQNLHHCCPETCQIGHGTGTTWGYQDGGKRQEGVREGMKEMMALTWGDGVQRDKDGGMLEVSMLEAYFSCHRCFWKIHYCHFVCSFNFLSECSLYCLLTRLSESVQIQRGEHQLFVCVKIQRQFRTTKLIIKL